MLESSKCRSNAKAAEGHDADSGLGYHPISFATDGHRRGLIGNVAIVFFVAQTIENSLAARHFPLYVPAVRIYTGIQLINQLVGK